MDRLAPAGRLRSPSLAEPCVAVCSKGPKQKSKRGIQPGSLDRDSRKQTTCSMLKRPSAAPPCHCFRTSAITITQQAVARHGAEKASRGPAGYTSLSKGLGDDQ